MKFTGSQAPEQGPSLLAISLTKGNPALAGLMDKCRKGEVLPELRYAESAEMARHPQEHGPRPADIPDFYEYVLRNVKLTCPVVADAPEQAFGLHFQQIEWKNAKRSPQPIPVMAQPAKLPPAPRSGTTKTFVVSWFAVLADANPNQCPKMNPKPTQEEYYALMSPERAAAQKAYLADKGGANTTYLPYRGPDEMNVTLLPGIVADPGFIARSPMSCAGSISTGTMARAHSRRTSASTATSSLRKARRASTTNCSPCSAASLAGARTASCR